LRKIIKYFTICDLYNNNFNYLNILKFELFVMIHKYLLYYCNFYQHFMKISFKIFCYSRLIFKLWRNNLFSQNYYTAIVNLLIYISYDKFVILGEIIINYNKNINITLHLSHRVIYYFHYNWNILLITYQGNNIIL